MEDARPGNCTEAIVEERQHSRNLTDVLTKSKFDPSRPHRSLSSEWLRLHPITEPGHSTDDGTDAAALQNLLLSSITFDPSKPLRSLPEEYDRSIPGVGPLSSAQAAEYVTLLIEDLFEHFDNYRGVWCYFEDGEWKLLYGIFSRPAADFYTIEFDDVVETRNVSRRIPKHTVVQLRRNGIHSD
jgi:hypothetical protein